MSCTPLFSILLHFSLNTWPVIHEIDVMTHKYATTIGWKNPSLTPLLPSYSVDMGPKKSPLHLDPEMALEGHRGG